MSPDEDRLRAALRDGENDGELSADRIRDRARVDRAHRRRSIINVAASVAVVVLVAGAGFGIAQLNHGSSEKSSSSVQVSSSAAQAQGDAAGRSAAASAPADVSETPSAASSAAASAGGFGTSLGVPAVPAPSGTAAATATAAGCPPSAPALPSTGTGSRTAALFPHDLTSLTVCVYQADSSRPAGAKVFDAQAANQIADALNASPGSRADQACPADLGPTVAMYPRTSGGAAPAVVGNLGGCGTTSDGQATRQARTELTTVLNQVLAH